MTLALAFALAVLGLGFGLGLGLGFGAALEAAADDVDVALKKLRAGWGPFGCHVSPLCLLRSHGSSSSVCIELVTGAVFNFLG